MTFVNVMSSPSLDHEQLLFLIFTKHKNLMQRTEDGYDDLNVPTNSVIRGNLYQKQLTIHNFLFSKDPYF